MSLSRKSRKDKFVFRKYSSGLCSVAIAMFFLGGGVVGADELDSTVDATPSVVSVVSADDSSLGVADEGSILPTEEGAGGTTPVAVSSEVDSDSTAVSSSDGVDSNVSVASSSTGDLAVKEPTETTGVVLIQDIDISSQTALNTTQRVYDFSKNSAPTSYTVTTDADKYSQEGYVFDFIVNATTGVQYRDDQTITVEPNTKQTFARIYRFVGGNTGNKDTLVKTDTSTQKDVYFVGALDSKGNALERFPVLGGGYGDPYLETGAIFEINGTLVWCYEPNKPTFAGAKYEAKIIDEQTKQALINNFGVGYDKYTKADYLLADIEQGMMWEADGNTHIFDKVQINRNNSGMLSDLTDEEKASISEFKSSIAKAIDVYNSNNKADLVYNGIHVSDSTSDDTVIELEEGKTDSIELSGNAEMLHYYKNGAIKTPDGTVLTVDDVRGIAKLDKLSSLKVGDYVLKMSMIRDGVQGDTTEWTHNGHQGLHDYRIKNPKWEEVRIRIRPKTVTEVPNDPPTVPDKPELVIEVPKDPPTVPDKPELVIEVPKDPPTVPDKPELVIEVPKDPPTVPDKPELVIEVPKDPPTVPDKPELVIEVPKDPPTVPDKPELVIEVPKDPPTVPDKPELVIEVPKDPPTVPDKPELVIEVPKDPPTVPDKPELVIEVPKDPPTVPEKPVYNIPTVPKTEVPKTEVPKTEVPKTEVPKTEVPKTEVPKTEVPQQDTPVKSEPKGLEGTGYMLPNTGDSSLTSVAVVFGAVTAFVGSLLGLSSKRKDVE